jgi:hypothetical protein
MACTIGHISTNYGMFKLSQLWIPVNVCLLLHFILLNYIIKSKSSSFLQPLVDCAELSVGDTFSLHFLYVGIFLVFVPLNLSCIALEGSDLWPFFALLHLHCVLIIFGLQTSSMWIFVVAQAVCLNSHYSVILRYQGLGEYVLKARETEVQSSGSTYKSGLFMFLKKYKNMCI